MGRHPHLHRTVLLVALQHEFSNWCIAAGDLTLPVKFRVWALHNANALAELLHRAGIFPA